MSYGRGRVTGTKRERQPRQATLDRLQAQGELIQRTLAELSVDQLLAMTPQEAQRLVQTPKQAA